MQHSNLPDIDLTRLDEAAAPPPRDPVEMAIDSLGLLAGIEGCALIDASTGSVLRVGGSARGSGSAWEAATDYWRLYHRHRRHFVPWGELRAAVFMHAGGAIGVLPCCEEPPLVVVVFARAGGIDWAECERLTWALGAALRSLMDRPLVNRLLAHPSS